MSRRIHLTARIAVPLVAAGCFATLAAAITLYDQYFRSAVVACSLSTAAGIIPCELPLRFPREDALATVTVWLDLPKLHPTLFRLEADDCIEGIQINGRQLGHGILPLCRYPHGATVDLKNLVRPGVNVLQFVVRNFQDDGRFNLRPSPIDRGLTFARAAAAAAISISLALLAYLSGLFGRRKEVARGSAIAFALGSVLRLFYYWSTAFWERAYDVWAHQDYIRYITETLRLPSFDSGWQTHHPPLYHVLAALYVRTFGASGVSAWEHLQLVGLIFSLLTLAVLIRAVAIVYSASGTTGAPLAALLIAVQPALIMLTPRINNDTLLVLLLAAALVALLEWWRSASLKWWTACIALTALALLTKANAAVFLGAALTLAAVREPGTRRGRAALALPMLLLIPPLAFYGGRALAGQRSVVADMSRSAELKVERELCSFLRFDPSAMLREPYVSSVEDRTRRHNLWEYLFRSAHFGEFDLDDGIRRLAQGILLFALVLLPVTFFGATRRGQPFYLPLATLTVLGFLAMLLIRAAVPYAPAQDFRYVAFLTAPLALFLAWGISGLQKYGGGHLGALALWCALGYAALCTLLIFAICTAAAPIMF